MSADLFTSGTKTLPAAGSQPVALASSVKAGTVLIYNNTGNSTVYVGDSAHTSSTGIPVAAGQSINVERVGDLGAIYISGTENDVVRYLASDNVAVG